MFLGQAGTFLSFQARRSSAKRSSTSDLTVGGSGKQKKGVATTHGCILRCSTQLGFEASKPHACVERSIKPREIPFSWYLLAPKKKKLD